MAWTTPATFTSGQILTAAQMNTNVRDNTNALYDSIKRLGVKTRSTDYTVDQTSLASAAEIFSSDITFTADGTSTYLLECFFPAVDSTAAGRQVLIHFTDGGNTSLLGAVAGVSGGTNIRTAIHVRHFWTPTSGSKSVNMKAINTGGTGNMYMDSATWANGYVALWGGIST